MFYVTAPPDICLLKSSNRKDCEMVAAFNALLSGESILIVTVESEKVAASVLSTTKGVVAVWFDGTVNIHQKKDLSPEKVFAILSK